MSAVVDTARGEEGYAGRGPSARLGIGTLAVYGSLRGRWCCSGAAGAAGSGRSASTTWP